MSTSTRSTTDWAASRTPVSWLARLLLGLSLAICLSAPAARAQQAAAEDGEAVEEQAAEQPILDLGMIHLKELRPAKHETIKLNFQLHLVLKAGLTEVDLKKLEAWKHRLRDQVIVAIRTAHSTDFREPGLSRLRQIILYRVEHVLKVRAVEGLLLSKYSFSID